jgi:arylsulfatase
MAGKGLTRRQFGVGVAAGAAVAGSARAQQRTGVPGSPDATTTIDGKYLPNPPQAFGGEINLNAAQSKPFWPARVVPPKGAPNVLLIMTDDVGFAAPSTFGGVIPTPALDRIANTGLRYTQFHSTALCSPTRAALITGRNHHAVGFGVVSEQATGFPGYDSFIGKESATIGRILKDNGYATSWFGKDHNTPAFQASQVGPFDQWPIGMGFDYFYGFVGGDTSQWQPNLFRNTTAIYPYVGNPQWNLITAMADDAIAHLRMLNSVDPDKPFFIHYVPGATHAPHHATPEWIKKISDMHLFDGGWNELRDTIFANQMKLGVIPPHAKLTPWPDALKQWDQLTADEKKMFIRHVDVYAAYLAYVDYEIGRVIQAVEDIGKLDNTLIIYISGDNGSRPKARRTVRPTRSPSSTASRCRSPTSSSISMTCGAPTGPTTTWRWAGPGPSTRRSSGPSRSPRISAARGRACAWRGLRASRTRAASATSSTTSLISCRRSWRRPGYLSRQWSMASARRRSKA